MSLRTRRLPIIVVVVAVAVVTILTTAHLRERTTIAPRHPNETLAATPATSTAKPIAAAPTPPSADATDSTRGAPRAPRARPAPRSIDSAAETRSILGAIAAGDTLALERRIDLAATCRPFVTGMALSPPPDTSLTQRIRTYCASYTDLIDVQALAAAMADREAGVSATVDVLRSLRTEQGEDVLAAELQRLLASPDPSDVGAALRFASKTAIQMPGIDDDRFRNPLINWTAVYEAASLLLHCRRADDCGPSGLYTYVGCVSWHLCTEGTTFREQVRALYAPMVFAEAERVVDEIPARRTR